MDIVERLRTEQPSYVLIGDAAIEIERLQEALQTIAEEGSGWGQSVALAALKEETTK